MPKTKTTKKSPMSAGAKNSGQRPKQQMASISVPAAQTSVFMNAGAKQRQLGKGVVEITHRESFTVVSSIDQPTSYQVIGSYAVNPASASFSSWLSGIGSRYEMYQFTDLRLQYVSSCPTTTPGNFMVMFDPDCLDDPPATSSEFMNHLKAMQTSYWKGATAVAPPAVLRKLFCNSGVIPEGSDAKTYNCCNIVLAYSGGLANTTYGTLFAEYTVRLFNPGQNSLETFVSQILQGIPENFGSNVTTYINRLFPILNAGEGPAGYRSDTDFRYPYAVPAPAPNRYIYLPEAGEYVISLMANLTGAIDGNSIWLDWAPHLQTVIQFFVGQLSADQTPEGQAAVIGSYPGQAFFQRADPLSSPTGFFMFQNFTVLARGAVTLLLDLLVSPSLFALASIYITGFNALIQRVPTSAVGAGQKWVARLEPEYAKVGLPNLIRAVVPIERGFRPPVREFTEPSRPDPPDLNLNLNVKSKPSASSSTSRTK